MNADGRAGGSGTAMPMDTDYDDDDDLRCCVCGYDMPFDDNDIVACSGCPVVVHQNCYGINILTKKVDWFCRACSHDLPPTTSIPCELCPFKGVSALALTSDMKWVHGHCSSWLLKMDPDQHQNMDMSQNPITDRCETCAPDKCSECIICHQGSKVQRCGENGCRNHFHPWCMSHHSGLPEPLVYWGHKMLTHNREALIPYHYCFEHKSSVPDVKDPEIMWHLPSKQIAVNRRATETTDEMRRLKNITTAREALQLPAAKETGLVGDEAHAAVLRMCNAALMKSAGLRVSRALEHALAVAAVVAERLKRGERGLDDRVQVAEELALSVAEMSFLVSYWLIHFVPETTKWPANVERKGREVQAHLSALRALCWVLLEGMRTGLDPLPAAHSGTGGRGGWRETRARNRFRALQGRSAFIDDEERCVMCLVKTQPGGEDGRTWKPKRCRACGVKRHSGCDWFSHKNVCSLCVHSGMLRELVIKNDMAGVHQRLLESPGASPFWVVPVDLSDVENGLGELEGLTTPLHEAARHGRYELLSMMLHHSRGRGKLPGACLAQDGSGKTAYDIATANNETECVRLFTTTFSDLRMVTPKLGWRPGQRTGKDISGGRERVPIPWVNEIDDEPFPSHTFTYINRVVEGNGSSFNWRLCYVEMPERNPTACHHKDPDENAGNGNGNGSGSGSGGPGLGAPSGFGAGSGLAWGTGNGGASGAPYGAGGSGGCDSMRCGHVNRGNENGRKYECNFRCPCAEQLKLSGIRGEEPKDCGLRASQFGVQAPLEAFKTATKGWGVRATRTIQEGAYICSYAGECISERTYQAREPEYERRDYGRGACYCFNVHKDKKNPDNNLVVDADRYRGVAALFNHSCTTANVKAFKLVANNVDPRYPIHGFFALKKIVVKEGCPGPELVFNYGTKEKPNPCLCSACEEQRILIEAPPRLR